MSGFSRNDMLRPCGCRANGVHRKKCPVTVAEETARKLVASMDLAGVCLPCQAAIAAALRSGPPHVFTTRHTDDAVAARCIDALRNRKGIAPFAWSATRPEKK